LADNRDASFGPSRSTWSRMYWPPVRVLPHPRPLRISQLRQAPGGTALFGLLDVQNATERLARTGRPLGLTAGCCREAGTLPIKAGEKLPRLFLTELLGRVVVEELCHYRGIVRALQEVFLVRV
jgi:hypothetical protein